MAGMKDSWLRFANVAVIGAASGWRALMLVILIASLSGCASQVDHPLWLPPELPFASGAVMGPPTGLLDRQPGESIVAKLPQGAQPVRIQGRECWVCNGRYYRRRGQKYEQFHPYQ
jgi:hypothetical protein